MPRLLILVPTLVALLALSSSAKAQDTSSACTKLLGSVVAELSVCIPFSSLAPIITSGLNTTAAQIDPVLKQICGAPPCPNSLITSVVTRMRSTCSDEIVKNGSFIVEAYTAVEFYPALYKSACLKNTAGEFCVEETLENYQADDSRKGGDFEDAVAVLPAKVICTACNKNIVNEFYDYVKTNATFLNDDDLVPEFLKLNRTLSTKCHVPFLDGVTNATSLGPTPHTVATFASTSSVPSATEAATEAASAAASATGSATALQASIQPGMAALIAFGVIVASWAL